jgi:hypothetical protein
MIAHSLHFVIPRQKPCVLNAFDGLLRSYSMPGLSYNSILGKFMVFTTDAEVRARHGHAPDAADALGHGQDIGADLILRGSFVVVQPMQLGLTPIMCRPNNPLPYTLQAQFAGAMQCDPS